MAFVRTSGRRVLLAGAARISILGSAIAGGGTTPVDPPVQAVGLYNPSDWVKKSFPTGSASGVTFAPTIAQPSGANDIVGINLGTPAGVAVAGRMDTMAHFFRKGHVQTTDRLTCFVSGVERPVQMNVFSTHSDGSVKHAALTFQRPALTANQTVPAMFRKGGSAPGASLSLSSMPAHGFTASLTLVNKRGRSSWTDGPVDTGAVTTVNTTYDVSPAAMEAYATSGNWIIGDLCIEKRYIRLIPDTALRVILDLRRYSDDTVTLKYQVIADNAIWANTGNHSSWTVSMTAQQGGTTIYSVSNFRVFQGFGFAPPRKFRSDLSAALNGSDLPPEHNVQFDVPYLIHAGALPPYDLSTGVVETAGDGTGIADYTNFGSPGFFAPSTGYRLETDNMPGVGGRPDIGIIPGQQAAFFQSGDERLRRLMMLQVDAVLGFACNFWDNTKGVPVNVFPTAGYPGIWIDDRAPGTQPANFQNKDPLAGRPYDGAHQPSVGYAPFLISGDRTAWDAIEKQAAFGLAFLYDAERTRVPKQGGQTRDWIVVQASSTRVAGWNMRDQAWAVHLSPDNAPLKSWFQQVIKHNYDHLLAQVNDWKSAQGEHYGWLAYCMGSEPTLIKPWMNEHWTSGTWCAWMSGCEEAGTYYRTFMENWTVQRFMKADNVFDVRRGSSYFIVMGNSYNIMETPPSYKTWAALQAAQDPLPSSNNGWSGGNYTTLALQSLTLGHMISQNPDALTAMNNVLNGPHGQPVFTDVASLRKIADATSNVRPMTKA